MKYSDECNNCASHTYVPILIPTIQREVKNVTKHDVVTMYNVRNIRISDGCVYARNCKGLGMHLVTFTNCDMVPFLLLVQYKGGLSEIEFNVSLFSNACMILLLFLKILGILCTSHYIKGGISHSC